MTISRDPDTIRVGLIGYGHAGAQFHAPFIASTSGLQLAAVVTRDPNRAQQARNEHPGVQIVDSPDSLWARAADLDLVVIASPNRTHVPLALAALEAGLSVVVDKPLAATPADARRVAEEARRRDLLLTVYQNRRWDGDFLTVHRLIEEGALGRVLRFESRFERWRPAPKPGWRERGAPEEAGGLLYDLGAHLIDQALELFGPVTSVYAEMDQRRPSVEVDDDTFVALTHASGVRSHLWMSVVAAQTGPRIRILGDRAAYTKFGMDVQEEALRQGIRPGGPRWGVEEEGGWGLLGVGDDLRPVRTEPGAYQQFYQSVAAALRDGARPPVDPQSVIAALEVIEAAQKSAAERRPVPVPIP